jgi:hypothetical protein
MLGNEKLLDGIINDKPVGSGLKRDMILGVRNLINKITGQDELIVAYNDIVYNLCVKSDELGRAGETEKQRELIAAIHEINETKEFHDRFNPFKTFQKGIIKSKIEQGTKVSEDFLGK